uniref:Uncharacterized protein n=1 Tax=Trichogramma kaykai TaxID=54128 RepID=A0ABD2WN13_9HYME
MGRGASLEIAATHRTAAADGGKRARKRERSSEEALISRRKNIARPARVIVVVATAEAAYNLAVLPYMNINDTFEDFRVISVYNFREKIVPPECTKDSSTTSV